MAEKYVDAIGIHPRTQQQGYGGEPDLDFARKLKAQTKLPVIYSGNVDETNFEDLLKEFDFVMLGRKAIGNPNLFSLLQNKKSKITFKHYLKLAEKYKIPFRQIKIQAMNFTKGLRGAKELRLKIFETRKINEIKNINF
jgi:tRNA-dihydrouridine synthase